MAKHLFDNKDFVKAYTISLVADKLPSELIMTDEIYRLVSTINVKRQSPEIK